jgi:hypothetical protein
MKAHGSLNKDTVRILHAVASIIDPDSPTTVRFVLYKLISQGILQSTEQYGKLSGILRDARIRGDISDDCFIDNKRTTYQVTSYSDLPEFMTCVRGSYARDFWQQQANRVEILVEKGTVGEVLKTVAKEYRVPLRISSGYYSRPFLCSIAADIADAGKPTLIGYVGDFDPSGFDIERAAKQGNSSRGAKCREGLYDILTSQYGFDTNQISWARLAITETDFLGLPTEARVPVKAGDTRKSDYVKLYCSHGAEVEALDLPVLRDRVKTFIEGNINQISWNESIASESKDIHRLQTFSI